MVSYIFVERKGQKYVSYHVCDPDGAEKWVKVNLEDPFHLMPFYSEKEKAERASRNSACIETELAMSWKAEKNRQDAIKAAWRKQSKKVRDLTKPSFPITNSIDWSKEHRESVRARVEAFSPPVSVKDRKPPIENPIFANVIMSAHFAGVPIEITDLFEKRIRMLGASSPEAAQAVFEHFAADPERLSKLACFITPKKGERITSPIVVPPELVELFHEKLHFPRNTGKGELGLIAMSSGDIELVSADKKGDFVWNKGTSDEESPEVKSVKKRFSPVRLGTTCSWLATEIQKRVLAVKELKDMSVSIGGEVVKSHKELIKTHLGMTIPEFVEEVTKELRKVIKSYDRMIVFIENENTFVDVDADEVYLFGTDGAGRLQFTLYPNNLTKLV